jgi:hypothetical protein
MADNSYLTDLIDRLGDGWSLNHNDILVGAADSSPTDRAASKPPTYDPSPADLIAEILDGISLNHNDLLVVDER